MIDSAISRLDSYQYIVIYVMLLISLVPVLAVSRTNSTTERIAYASSFGNKLPIN